MQQAPEMQPWSEKVDEPVHLSSDDEALLEQQKKTAKVLEFDWYSTNEEALNSANQQATEAARAEADLIANDPLHGLSTQEPTFQSKVAAQDNPTTQEPPVQSSGARQEEAGQSTQEPSTQRDEAALVVHVAQEPFGQSPNEDNLNSDVLDVQPLAAIPFDASVSDYEAT